MELIVHKERKFKRPQMVAAWPGMALLAKMSVDYLIHHLHAKPFAEIRSRGNSITIKNGVADTLVARDQFYHDRNTVMFSGQRQPGNDEDIYKLAELVIDLAENLKVQRLFTIAAFPAAFSDPPKVYGTANRRTILQELRRFNIPILRDGFVTGLNGVLIGVAKERDIDAVCLLGQVHSINIPQPRTVKAVLDVLATMLEINIDTRSLVKQAEQMEQSIQKELERLQSSKGKKETQFYIS